ncbi:hypothetical protein ACN5L6_003491 [Cronobacter dublinensis]
MALSSCEMALVVQAVRRLTLTAYSLPSASAEEVGFCPHPKPHLVWYLFALCQRTVEFKERCQSVPFGCQHPADVTKNTWSIFICKYSEYLFWLIEAQIVEYSRYLFFVVRMFGVLMLKGFGDWCVPGHIPGL